MARDPAAAEEDIDELSRRDIEDRRITKIADFVKEGKIGQDLERALKKWEKGEWERGRSIDRRIDEGPGSPTNIPASARYSTALSSEGSSAPTPGSSLVSPTLPSQSEDAFSPSSWTMSTVPSRSQRSRSPPHAHSHDSPRRRPFPPAEPQRSPLHQQLSPSITAHEQPTSGAHSDESSDGYSPHLPVDHDLEHSSPAHTHRRSTSAPAPDRRPLLPRTAASTSSVPVAATHGSDAVDPYPSHPAAMPQPRTSPFTHTRRDTVSLPINQWPPTTVPTSSCYADQRLGWGEEEARRRQDVAAGRVSWPSIQEHPEEAEAEFEPVREGSFQVHLISDGGMDGGSLVNSDTNEVSFISPFFPE